MENAVTGGQGRDDNIGVGPIPEAGDHFVATVNRIELLFAKPEPDAARILEKAGFLPPADHILIQQLHRETRSVNLEDTVDLRLKGQTMFWAFKSDRIFRFTLDGRGYDWGEAHIGEPIIREIGDVAEDEIVVLDRDGKRIELKPEDVLDLGHAGTEHLHTTKRLVTVFYEREPREIPGGVYTTEELKTLFTVPAGYILEFVNEEGHLTPLKPGEKLRVKDGMKFFTQVPCGGSS